ncbi:MAG TPA: ribulose-phosphate 3-epimerase [Acidimicrobiales bacterium]|nr:ribulose-phosphate 3-epimerase [Acidimicrobiales bacterium]
MVRIAPSILSADFADLAGSIEALGGEADLLHVDVMDGHFVPNLTIGPPVVKSIRAHTALPLDCHLMVTNPSELLEPFAKAGADGCSVHVEVGGTDDLIAQMRDLGLQVGLAVNPQTPFEAFEPYLDAIDLLLLMTVVPGFGGQAFMAEVVPKIERAAAAITAGGFTVAIEVDGGIDKSTAGTVVAAGAEILVAGNAVFGASDPGAAAKSLRAAADTARAAS